ncbi:hypothetical protein LJC31_02080 [Synergistaceae bacterium OttesenSCG-928-I11]|nr:hypothetical protein [Synergistaceae bacterium OttesenSCG-928-I11]
MVSTYHGIETGRRAITYFRKSMEVAGTNTSKANTEGYSRQVVNKTASAALSTSTNYSMLGTGVDITSIERMRDQFLDARKRRATVDQTYWQTMATGMERVDSFIVGTNDIGVNNLLDNFWTAIQDVHINPNNGAIRGFFLDEADTLVQFAYNLSATYNSYRDELNNDISAMVQEANGLIDQIALLNKGITQLVLSGAEPNELLDKRDLLVDQLCTLTGATATTSVDERDNAFKVMIGGRIVVQGTNVRHLMLVENEANKGYYDIQIEYNQYDITSNPDAVGVILEQRADDQRMIDGSCTMDALHEIEVVRTADELYWTVGYGLAQSEGGERMDGFGSADTPLGIEGSFALQVGSAGVRAYSEVFGKTPPGPGIVLGEPGPGEPTSYSFRVSAGDFETTLTVEWKTVEIDDPNDPNIPPGKINVDRWVVSDNAVPPSVTPFSSATENLTVDEIVGYFNENYPDSGVVAKNDGNALVFESADRQIVSVTDINGSLMQSCGLANDNPIVKIEVTKDDTLQTIANKINNAYMFDKIVAIEGEGDEATTERLLFYETVPADTAPSSPEEWMHASVEVDANGNPYLCLTSNVAGEANRINVMSGSVCGDSVNDMTVARLLGLVEAVTDENGNKVQSDVTSYIQLDRANDEIITRYTQGGDVFVDDAYVILDGKEYLSSANEFKNARQIAVIGEAKADTMEEFSPGIRVVLNGVGTSEIIVRHHLTEGTIFSYVKLRDDILLSHTDVFDEMMYELATQFNAIHYAGYGTGDYKNVSGMAFFEAISNQYGAFSKLKIDDEIISDDGFNHERLAAMSGDGKGSALGTGDGSNALAIAQLKQAKLFMSGTADFNGLYTDFVAVYGSFGQRSEIMLSNQNYIVEQIEIQRQQIMGVNADEEMLTLVEMNQNFNYASQYISTLMQVIDQIISGLGRVGI